MATAETTTIEGEDAMQRQLRDAHLKFPSFPYKPYSIQIDFMNALYQSLNRGGISMLESPTGTGKTLSIICSALQWLVDQNQQKQRGIEANPNQVQTSGDSDDEPDWLRNFSVDKGDKGRDNVTKAKKKEARFVSAKLGRRRVLENCRDTLSISEKDVDIDRMKTCENFKMKDGVVEMNDEDFLLEEYESEEEEEEGGIFGSARSKRKVGGLCDSSSTDDEEEGHTFDVDDDEEEEERLKVYFCSRTHSQLSQFVMELKKTNLADELIMVCLGSRKNFCINEEVLKLGSTTRINERCLELQTKKKKEVSKIMVIGQFLVSLTNWSTN